MSDARPDVRLRVVQLQAENIKRIRAVDIIVGEDEPVVVISGRNAQGKSSVLDAIWYALGGKDAAPSKPIREGTSDARISLNLGKLVVTRTFEGERSRLEVRSPDGATYNSPQTLLDSLLGELTFDPLEFARQDRKRQRETLLRVMHVSVDDILERHKTLFDERTAIGREVRAAKILLDENGQVEGELPEQEISVSGIHDRITDARLSVRDHEAFVERRDQLLQRQTEINGRVERLRKEIETLLSQQDANAETIAVIETQFRGHVAPDLGALSAELTEAAEVNEKIQQRRSFRAQLARLKEREAAWKSSFSRASSSGVIAAGTSDSGKTGT